MPIARLFALSVAIAGSLTACAGKRIPEAARPQTTLVVLLPDDDSGTVGRARVSNEFGFIDLTAPHEAAQAIAAGRPERRRPGLPEIARVFDSVLAALPPASRHFTLRFRFGSDELTDESLALLPEILKVVRAHPVPEVAVVGHTDTMGDAAANVALGMKRASSVQELLVAAGIEASIIDVSSHGEADPLVKTPNNVAEPRNRRVEIVVR